MRLWRPRDRNALTYGVTAGISAWALLRGQLADMQARGWHVTVVADGDDRLAAAGVREGVHTVPLAMAREIHLGADARALVKWIILLARTRPSVLNVGTPKAALLGSIAGALTRVPRRVYVVRGLRFEGATGRRRSILLAMEKLTMRCATDVVVVSRSVGQEMLKAGLTSRPLLLIGDGSSNGVDVEGIACRAAQVDRASVRARFDVPADDMLVAFVGRLTLDKGAETLRDALRHLAARGVGVTLLAIGDAESGEAVTMLRDPVLRVRLTGWTNDPVQFLAAADALVLPTRREGYPNVVLEANACGVPVVTTTATGAVDSVVDGETGLLVGVGDAAGLAEALERLAHDTALRASMSDAAAERARTKFARERIWDGLASIYAGCPSDDVSVVTA